MKFYYTWVNKRKIPVNILFSNITIAVIVLALTALGYVGI